jgi:hypothetical protein
MVTPFDSDDDDLQSVTTVSEISERELDYQMEASKQLARPVLPLVPPPPPDDEPELESDPWNAMVVVGLRVYHKVSEDNEDREIVKLRAIRPNPYALDDEDDDDGKKKKRDEATDECKVLDLDDSAKDATLGTDDVGKGNGVDTGAGT